MLMDLQNERCFYCGGSVGREGGHVDHFIPWAKYPIDLGHNFVLADSNGTKRDRMPHFDHLSRWSERNMQYGVQVRTGLMD